MFLGARELASWFFLTDSENAFVVEMRICDEKDFAHIHQYGVPS
jgi:hypothetical protein